MKYLLIITALLIASCGKDCTKCEYQILDGYGVIKSDYYSQEEEGNCEIDAATYEQIRREELQTTVDWLTLESQYDNEAKQHYYTIDCY